jgi:pyruvate/2-oxoglutarate dehydrogenase complex dihydrolipoamide dehydrogenase (E3) component
MDKAGHIVVDEYQNTTAKNIYALGDVCGKALLTPGGKLYLITCIFCTSKFL